MTRREALRIAARTSGRAILVSGVTVMIAMAGLFLTGIDVFSGIAVGTILVVGVAVLGSLTFLPAILSMLGKWTDRGRIPWLGRRRTAARDSRFWGSLARAVVRRPLIWGGVATAVLLALAAPVLSLHLEDPGIHELPGSVPVVRSLIDISARLPRRPRAGRGRRDRPGPGRQARQPGRGRAAHAGGGHPRRAPRADHDRDVRSRPGAGGVGAAGRRAAQTPPRTTRWPRCATTRCPPRSARCRGSATRWPG